MIVYASVNGGSTYPYKLYSNAEDNASGANFATGNITTTDFVPASAADWCAASATGVTCPVLNLDALSGQSNVKLKFEIYNDYGNNIYVDNISFTGCIANAGAPVANFMANNTTGCSSAIVNFTDQSTNSPTSWTWQFTGGNPATSNQQNPSVTYSSVGTYGVSLTVSNANGSDSKTTNGYITIYPNPSTAASAFSASCPGINNGRVDLTVIGGTSPFTYSWTNNAVTQDINGLAAGTYSVTVTDAHSCTATRSVPVSTGAAVQLSASVQNDSGGAGIGSISLTVSNGSAPYTYQWSNGGSTATITGLTAGSYSVTVNDPNGCQATGTYTVSNVAAASVSNFSGSPTSGCGSLVVTFTDLSTNAPTSWTWQFTGGTPSSSTQQNPTVTYNTAGTYNVSLASSNATGGNTKTVNGYITVYSDPTVTIDNVQHDGGGCSGSINISAGGGTQPYTYEWSSGQTSQDVANICAGNYSVIVTDSHGCTQSANTTILAPATITGSVITEMNVGVPTATVTLTGITNQVQVTPNSGLYEFSVSPGENYIVTPSKSNDDVEDNGVTTLDILMTQKHILLVQELTTPYKIIAADVNSSSSVSSVDLVLIRSLILHNTTTFTNGKLWSFVSSDFIFSDVKNPFPFTASRNYINASGNYANQNFVGVKLGDVNNSWNANIAKAGAAGEVHFVMDDYNALPGEEITIPVKVTDFNNITGYQFTLSWNPAVLQFQEAVNQSLSGYFGENEAGAGMLIAMWYSETTDAFTLNDDAVVFNLKFEVIGQTGSSSTISIGSELAPVESYDNNLDIVNVIPENGLVNVGTTSVSSPGEVDWSYTIYPNPVNDVLNVSIKMKDDDELKLVLYNSIGQELAKESFINTYEANTHFDMKSFKAGIYFIRMESKGKTVVTRVIRINN